MTICSQRRSFFNVQPWPGNPWSTGAVSTTILTSRSTCSGEKGGGDEKECREGPSQEPHADGLEAKQGVLRSVAQPVGVPVVDLPEPEGAETAQAEFVPRREGIAGDGVLVGGEKENGGGAAEGRRQQRPPGPPQGAEKREDRREEHRSQDQ